MTQDKFRLIEATQGDRIWWYVEHLGSQIGQDYTNKVEAFEYYLFLSSPKETKVIAP